MNDPIQALKDAGYHVITDRPVSKRLNAFINFTRRDKQYYRDPLIVKLLSNAKLRKGHALTGDQLIRIVKPGEHSERFIQAASYIVDPAFWRGYVLTCSHCTMVDWYPLEQPWKDRIVDSEYRCRCSSCRYIIYLPINTQIEYKLKSLFQEALKGGALTVLNTLTYLNESKKHSERYHVQHFTVEVKNRHLHTDIDLLLHSRHEDSLLVECKDNFKTTAEAIAELQRTIETGLMLADTLGYQYVFATLKDEVPLAIQQQLDAGNARLLTANDLLKPYEG